MKKKSAINKMISGIVAVIALLCIFEAFIFWKFNQLQVNGPVYKAVVEGKDIIADILPPPKYIIESYLTTLQLMLATSQEERDALGETSNTARIRIRDATNVLD
jgi:hypothetical protein